MAHLSSNRTWKRTTLQLLRKMQKNTKFRTRTENQRNSSIRHVEDFQFPLEDKKGEVSTAVLPSCHLFNLTWWDDIQNLPGSRKSRVQHECQLRASLVSTLFGNRVSHGCHGWYIYLQNWVILVRENVGKYIPIGSMYGIYANIWGILMVNVTIYTIHGSYGI